MAKMEQAMFMLVALCGLVISHSAQVRTQQESALLGVIDQCAPGCKIMSLNNGVCDDQCNNAACRFDGEDCVGVEPKQEAECAPGCSFSLIHNGVCDEACNVRECGFDSQACLEIPDSKKMEDMHDALCDINKCPPYMIGDGTCDAVCNRKECKLDGGDCESTGGFIQLLTAILKALKGMFTYRSDGN